MSENRLRDLTRQRENAHAEIERQKTLLSAETNKDRTANRFVGRTEGLAETLKSETVGLQRLEDFQEKKKRLEEQIAREAARTDELKAEVKQKKKKKKEKKAVLSFGDEDEDGTGSGASTPGESQQPPAKRTKLSKDPTVNTAFLPDREREEQERRMREELRQEWLKKQEEMKGESIEITFSYWDGSGHRKEVECKKGDTIAQFLDKAKGCFSELRSVSTDNLIYIKEDLIIPHHYTFYDFIVSKARGKSGPLFNFDVHDDVRMIADATVEKDESHAGKVVERSWYNNNKHIFPASRWEIYQPDKDYGNYKIRN